MTAVVVFVAFRRQAMFRSWRLPDIDCRGTLWRRPTYRGIDHLESKQYRKSELPRPSRFRSLTLIDELSRMPPLDYRQHNRQDINIASIAPRLGLTPREDFHLVSRHHRYVRQCCHVCYHLNIVHTYTSLVDPRAERHG